MVKQVFDNDGVAHAFAAGRQDHGRSQNGNFYFHGDTLYSYGAHYPVVRLDRETETAYFNSDQSSVTTEGKHKSAARRALRHFNAIYLPHMDVLTRRGWCKLDRDDLAKYIQRIAEMISELEDKRSRMRAEWKITQNEHQCNELRNAAQTVWKLHKRRGDCFSVAAKDTKKERDQRTKRHLERGLSGIEHRIENTDRVLTEIKEKTCSADAWSYRSVIRELQYTKDGLYPSLGFGLGKNASRKDAVRVMGASWVKDAEETCTKWYKIAGDVVEPVIDDRLQYFEARLAEMLANDVEQWVKGEIDKVPHGAKMTLRIKGDQLETSEGARVPLPDAIELTRAAMMCRRKAKMWQRNGERKRVGMFECNRITQNGDLIVGCHNIPWVAIVTCVRRFADVLPHTLVTHVKATA